MVVRSQTVRPEPLANSAPRAARSAGISLQQRLQNILSRSFGAPRSRVARSEPVVKSRAFRLLVHTARVARVWRLLANSVLSIRYISREVRDNEKLGGWDFEGLLAPTFGLVYTFLILQSLMMVYEVRIEKTRTRYSRYAIWLMVVMFIINTVCSIVYNDKFRAPYGPLDR